MKKSKDLYHRFNLDPFHTHQKLLDLVESGSKVLEIGCSTGYFSEKLVKKNCRVLAVEKDQEAVSTARQRKNVRVVNCAVENLTSYLPAKEKFDVILLADVLEHLPDPLIVLIMLKKYLAKNGKIVLSVPNIANFAIRFKLLFGGDFTYQDFGILDKTHLRFFTKKTIEQLLKQAGLESVSFDVVAGLEASKIYKRSIGRIVFRVKPLRLFESYLTKIWPEFLALEFLYEVKIKQV